MCIHINVNLLKIISSLYGKKYQKRNKLDDYCYHSIFSLLFLGNYNKKS